jgi:uncharacterized protein YbjT (DUF2867 family)
VIFIAGGTGTLGATLVRTLSRRGDPVRMLTRTEQHADPLRQSGVEVVIGDVRDAPTVATAMRGCATVISAIHGFTGTRGITPASIDRDGNRTLIRAAVEAGVDHMVLVSVYGAAPTHPMSLHRMKHAAEQSLVGSGLRWTILRPVPFMETWIDVIGAHLIDRGKAVVPGPGDNPITFVSVRDVATVLDRSIRDSTMRGRRMDIIGPESVTLRHIAERLVAADAGPSRIVHIPLVALRTLAVLAKPLAPAFARQAQAAVVMNTTDMTARYDIPPGPTDAGHAATTFDELIQAASRQSATEPPRRRRTRSAVPGPPNDPPAARR